MQNIADSELASMLAEVRTRPAYALCSAWIEQHVRGTPRTAEATTSVGWLVSIIELATGAAIEEDTAVVALHDLGYRLSIVPAKLFVVRRDHPGAECDLDESVLLDVLHQRNHNALPERRFRLWGDGITTGGAQ